MSTARSQFLASVNGIEDAVSLDIIAAGTTTTPERNGILVLRRGILVAALVTFETFVRDRTSELLHQLSRWPGHFEDLPQGLRDASLLNALSNLQKYASMLKKQKEDYQSEIIGEITKMAACKGPNFGFTKFVAGDYTGNISELGLKDLLLTFQIEDCWNTFRQFSADIGFGVPSVQQLLADVVRKRHRSAHVAGFTPAATDIAELGSSLFCLGICFDIAMTASVEQALAMWQPWSERKLKWRDGVDLFLVDHHKAKLRVTQVGKKRAIVISGDAGSIPKRLPRPAAGRVAVVVFRDVAGLPKSWLTL